MRNSVLIAISTFLLIVNLCSDMNGQGRPPGVGTGRSTTTTAPTGTDSENGTGLFGRKAVKPDTFDTQYFYLDNPFLILDKQDTLLSNDYAQPDPAYHGDYAFANLGNLGSPLSPLVYESNLKNGLNIGFNNFDKYYFQKEQLKFFKLKSAYTNATYSQGRSQDDQHLRVIFAKEFGKSLSFSIEHHRINHLGVFRNQLARNYALNTGFWYHNPSGKYQAFITLTSNSTLHLENGGIVSENLLAGELAQEENVPVWLSQDTTRYQMRSGGIVQYYHLRSPIPKKKRDTSVLQQFPLESMDSLGNLIDSTLQDSLAIKIPRRDSFSNSPILKDSLQIKTDSIQIDSIAPSDSLDTFFPDSIQIDSLKNDSLLMGSDSTIIKKRKRKKPTRYYDPNRLIPDRRQVSLGHELNFFRGFYKYADLNADSTFYKNLYVYNQGLQYRIAHSGIENSFFISTASIKKRRTGKTQQPRDFFKAGIKHSFNKYNQLNDSLKTNNLSIFGDADLLLFNKLRLAASAGIHLAGYNAGDFFLKGDLKISANKIGTLKLHALSQAFSPSVMQNRFIVSGVQLWDNDFQKTVETKIGGVINITKTGTQIGINFQLLDNFIYHDTLGIVQQNEAVFAIPQLIIKQPINIGIFHLENTLVLQRSNLEVLALPTIFSKHNLYLETKIFKEKMLVRLGAEGIYHTEYHARKYQPLLGQFYNSDANLTFYPQIDPYISIKRGGFRFYVRAQNLSNPIVSDQLNEQFGYRTPDYPIPYRVIRFGISWMLLN